MGFPVCKVQLPKTNKNKVKQNNFLAHNSFTHILSWNGKVLSKYIRLLSKVNYRFKLYLIKILDLVVINDDALNPFDQKY